MPNNNDNDNDHLVRPKTLKDYDPRSNDDDASWIFSFAAHARGVTVKAIEYVALRSPLGVYGLLAMPIVTLTMEKTIYDTVQAAQGVDPNLRPADRGGFPSGGADLPSFSLVPVQKQSILSMFSQKHQ
eukprot:CAMPEP_0118720148 /NCGR_PEP_ID=MMETSP0800-20121206/29936_1 /TAXON_ID=210618 ORGANISM="Striatella unipunctata, Strain CCMP2910" /NCGR_SAMPLE_ID=MMETSP0800 /ASSEMBLY_ACC=CAM_ASM_000638 /LENGTH=127 /DNA_ID=CAMNT_0006627729 /DNA_START=80 /DNA_END=466 /DNA_ORIENTATION=-